MNLTRLKTIFFLTFFALSNQVTFANNVIIDNLPGAIGSEFDVCVKPNQFGGGILGWQGTVVMPPGVSLLSITPPAGLTGLTYNINNGRVVWYSPSGTPVEFSGNLFCMRVRIDQTASTNSRITFDSSIIPAILIRPDFTTNNLTFSTGGILTLSSNAAPIGAPLGEYNILFVLFVIFYFRKHLLKRFSKSDA